jgi:hypothetical protein
MPPTCSICASERKADIDRDLIGPDSLRAIAGRYDVSSSSLDRHRHRCLAPKAAAAIARREEVSADRLVSYVNGLLEYALSGMLRARSQDPVDDYGVRAYMGEARKNVELIARLGGVIGSNGPVVQVVDARRQVAVLANLSEDELRALARGDSNVIDGDARELSEAVSS